jgi:hypothetical protein
MLFEMLSSCCYEMATVSYSPFSVNITLSYDPIGMDVRIATYSPRSIYLDVTVVQI